MYIAFHPIIKERGSPISGIPQVLEILPRGPSHSGLDAVGGPVLEQLTYYHAAHMIQMQQRYRISFEKKWAESNPQYRCTLCATFHSSPQLLSKQRSHSHHHCL